MKFALALMIALLTGCHAGGPPLRVMSFNIRYDNPGDGPNRWEERRDLVVDVIRHADPDLLGTQEVLAHQAEFLREQLPGYEYFGAGRDDGELKGEMSAIFYRADRFERLDGGHFWLSETPDVPGSKSWDAALPRMVTWLKLRDSRDGAELFFLNTHFDHRGEQARALSAMLLRRRALEQSDGAPLIITGDFNASAEGLISALLRVGETGGRPLLDTYRAQEPEREPGEGTFNGFTGDTSSARIDWIVVSEEFDVREASIIRTTRDGRWPSDHFPVTAVVRMRSPGD